MPAETEEALNFQGLCHYIRRLSKAAKAGMKAALADTPKCHFAWLEALLHAIRSRGQDGAISVSDLAHEVHQPLPAISRRPTDSLPGNPHRRTAVKRWCASRPRATKPANSARTP